MAVYSHSDLDFTVLMTANNAPSPNVASASEEDAPDNLAFRAFDHVADGSVWLTNVATTGWLKFDFGSGNGKTVVKYTVSNEDNLFGDVTLCPKTWTFQGSNDDSNWTTLDTQTNVAAWSNAEMRTYEFINAVAYRYYRINVTANQGGALLLIGELELLAAEIEVEITEGTGISDSYEAFTLTEEIINNVGISDIYAAVVLSGKITDAAGMSDVYEIDTPHRNIADSVGMSALFECGIYFAEIAEAMGISDVFERFAEKYATITNEMGVDDENTWTWHILRSIQNNIGIADLHEATRLFNKLQSETLSSWDTLKWGWHKSIADSMAIAETVSKILGIPVKDWLVLTDTESNNWNGSEAVSDSIFILDISKAVKVYADSIADGMAIVDAVNIALELMITDILTCTDTVLNVGAFQHSIADSMTLEDIVKRAFPKSISDSFTITDTSLIDFLVLLQISDSLAITETTTPGLTISQTIADALEALDTVTIKQLLQELIQEGLNIDVSVVVDGEIWECWVLNTSSFHPSVYSGYDYNSFALFNSVAYGCKSDGIYELAGDTDNGTAFHSGIILPKTRFGSAHNKRFRKAYFDVSGDDLVMKMETDNGWRTFRMTDTEMSLTRDLKGRKWEISLEDFDELDSISLIPVILSRK